MTSGTPKRIIRIFISSTFRNFENERDILAKEVFGPLRDYCEANGFSFHPIDLRWGISYEDSMRNTAVRICLEEIRRSKELSPEINFMIMAGDSYGWQPIPEKIECPLWDAITSGQDASGREMKILNRYYRQDKNDLNRSYCLMPRYYTASFADHAGITDETVREILDRFLDEAEVRFGRGNADDENADTGEAAAEWSRLFSDAKWKLNASATEQEITEGYFSEKNASRFNTFILLKNENQAFSGSSKKQSPAALLREHLKKSAADGEKLRIYEKQSEDDTGWIEAVRIFLKKSIDAQIEHYRKQDRQDLERENLESAYDFVNANYVNLHSSEAIENLLDSSSGHPILVCGASGSGKSWFLRHYASFMKEKCTVAAVFNDVEPGGRNFISALEMITDAISRSGTLSGEMTLPDAEDPAGWFEAQLCKITPGKKIIIILDSINIRNMPDYLRAKGKSLFKITLPPDVYMIVSAVSDDDLREADKLENPSRLTLRAMGYAEAYEMLQNILKKRGRCLNESASDPQLQTVRECIAASPGLRDALSIEVMAEICGRLRSWEEVPFSGRVSFSHLTGLALFHQRRDDYILLRSHALGYLALSEAGLTEPEIIDLLSGDEDVVREIKIQTEKNNSPWKFGDKIPTVLWAVLYADIKPFLTEINDEGIPLLGLRHLRLTDEILTRLGQKEQINLLLHMRNYYKNKGWLLYSGNIIRPNLRKVQEYFPIYEKLQDTDTISENLRDPLCIDSFVRAGRQSLIREYLEKYGKNVISSEMLMTLQEKELMFRLWPDSFISACISRLRMSPDQYIDIRAKQELLTAEGNPYYISGNGRSGKGIFFPEFYGKGYFALSRDGMAACLENGVIRIIDMRKKELLNAKCASVREECFLYWRGENLTVRCERRRLTYVFRNGQLNFRAEEKNVPDWGDLLVREEKKIPKMYKAGGWTEAEHFGFEVPLYHIGDELLRRNIYEEYDDSFRSRVSGHLAAIVLDHKKLIVSDLRADTRLYEEKIKGITNLEWSESGRELLVVTGGNTLRIISIDPEKPIGMMEKPHDSYLHHKAVNGEKFAADYVRTMRSAYAYNQDAYTAENGPSSEIPLFGALSVKYGWAACYLYELTGPVIRVKYDKEHGGGGSRIDNIDAITYEDLKTSPFYTAPGLNGLVLISYGKPVLFDMKNGKSGKAAEYIVRKPPDDETAGKIRKKYVNFISEKLHLKTGEWPGKLKGAKGFIFGRSKHKDDQIERFKALAPYYRLLASKIIKSGRLYWLIDGDNGMFHAFDERGRCLCHDMVTGKILDADIDARDGSLSLFLDTRQTISVTLQHGAFDL